MLPRFPKPAEGSWTEHYPELGTAPVSYEDSISPEFYEVEREAVFKRAWLNVGRVEQIPRTGNYFTKELKVVNTSIIVVRNRDGKVNAFHNICRHRGNKLVWDDDPRAESSGTCRQFVCKYHAWRYDLDGNLTFVQQEEEFFDLDKNRYGLVPVHCDVWEGFIFVNFAPEPEQPLREFLGPMITGLEGYPFGELTQRFYYRSEVKANWKLYLDAFQEFYHAPVLHANQSPTKYSKAAAEAGFEAPYYRIDGPHRLVSTSGVRVWEMDSEMRKPIEDICRSGLFGPWDGPDLGEMPAGLNPAKCDPWGLDSFQLFPNFVMLLGHYWHIDIWFWPLGHDKTVITQDFYAYKAKTLGERVSQEFFRTRGREVFREDLNTLEAQQEMLSSGAMDEVFLSQQEIGLQHHYRVAAHMLAQP